MGPVPHGGMSEMKLIHIFQQRLLKHEGQRLIEVLDFFRGHGHRNTPHGIRGKRHIAVVG